ncbi:anthranilate phosphoribosyltransferase [bacterium (Candidatus Blackallbacteria) CG17_big_fil_post_rev_8_21_14_2_50_48_46]|uniref:Anthranilate phosphoribosyltransferase n=1 Tax=bacterium (Candidatus Blackallbacteria) CG17_big_fil_post_rev_8_21_14_2_50_48_46 TaxID=2014261 RepID=A0A2M7FY98_9BACT|nr:MAG: anthranilate phosphoribosyltransferase [bacterium (Candidatus Blackallbacteria) CG18_big_fil_WC_8_21_14_2_50_49_26]PIW14305.1 MAG: anthranilate phosphoribosyltransferase [bacterium (Candidatus Blackallbacteria) CG17_big_fil_post_rev_8_21_14_2_50_48_46]PIW45574.1 MAG: anthranilate phosphoribosyltransferase [bacterium (Candidatus Blackallbacteria) CG13_big_fil_rev_8_21_14_2_50_49_14]
MKTVLETLFAGAPLGVNEAEAVLDRILNGEVPAEVTGALLAALRMRGETPAEITGFARALRARMQRVETHEELTLDTCGTGGDGGLTFNVSTAVSLLLASLDVPVVKHGNRAVSSRSGSADVLEALGIPLQNSAEGVRQALETSHFGFCFAPAFHPILKELAPLRRNLGVRTIFNLLGPLCNPAEVSHQLLGVYDRKLTPVLAEVLRQLGTREALVVASYDGLDELSLAAPTQVSHLKAGQITHFELSPEEAGLKRQPLTDLEGGSAQENALILERIFQGQKGAARDLVCYNAAAALWITGKAPTLREGVHLAAEALDQGKVLKTLELLRRPL